MTITHDDIYKRFLIEYDKANITSSYPSLTVYEAVAILNKAYVALISQKLTGNNPRRASFEADLKAIEDLQPLIKTSGPHTVQQYIFGAENEYIIEYPLDMMYYLQSFLRGSDNKTHNTNLITHQSALEFKKTAINTPWIEQPVVYMENNLIHTLVDDSVDTDLLNAYITYIKTPEWFEVELVEGYEEDPSEWHPTTPQQQNPFILAEEGRVAAEEARVLAESERQDSEETRQLAEQQRTSAEEQRDAAESLRITAETLRDDEETLRNSAELQRKNGEQTRISYEGDRELAEQARSASELGRVTAELSRVTAEVERNTAENSRVTAELSRQTLESNRADAEGQRASAEISRISTEENRNSAEQSRVANESSRVLAELARVSAENQRVAAEQLRLAAVAVAQQDIEDLLENKADVNGYYETLGAGVATNLRGGLIHDHQFAYRKTGGNEEVLSDLAYVTKIKGNTVAWNQLFRNGDFSDGTNFWFVSSATGTMQVSGNVLTCEWNNEYTNNGLRSSSFIPQKHTYYLDALVKNNIESDRRYRIGQAYGVSISGDFSANEKKRIRGLITVTTSSGNGYDYFGVLGPEYTQNSVSIEYIECIDLTLIYGEGNEPTTVEQFEADYFRWFGKPLAYEPYDKGSLRNVQMSGIKSVGFNLWDEEWENGIIESDKGQDSITSDTTYIRSKNYIPIIQGQSYFITKPSQQWGYVFYYDINKNYLGRSTRQTLANNASGSRTLNIPAGCVFVRFIVGGISSSYTYNHDICINLSDPSKNGTYEPYWEDTIQLPVTTLTGKLNGEGSDVVIFPDGMNSAGNVYDEIEFKSDGSAKAIRRVGSVDLGTLTWSYYDNLFYVGISNLVNKTSGIASIICQKYAIDIVANSTFGGLSQNVMRQVASTIGVKDANYSDAATFKTAMNGVMLYYELATPIEYEIENIYLPPLKVDNGGTEQILPDNSPDVITCAPTLSIMYGLNAAETLKSLPTNYISVLSLDSLIGCIQSALDINITKTWEPGLNRYVFTFEQNELQTEPGAGE